MMDRPISPLEATPLDVSRKRKYREIIDLTGDDDADNVAAPETVAQNGNHSPQHHDDEPEAEDEEHEDGDSDEDDDDDQSMMEDMADAFDVDPYTPGPDDDLSDERIDELRNLLRDVGPRKFLEQTLQDGDMRPRKTGMAFGLDPSFPYPDNVYLRLLGLVINRFYYKREKLPQYNTIDDAARLLREKRNIIVITGAGISTSLGIPDFRSKGTGFYDALSKMGWDSPEDIFNIENFTEDPGVFYKLAHLTLPSTTRTTPTHGFLRLLQDHHKLLTNYTQNIDNIESLAGLKSRKIIQCHGSFATATCCKCKRQVPGSEIEDDIRQKRVARCKACPEYLKAAQKAAQKPQLPKKSKYSKKPYNDENEEDDMPEPGVMKPDITFFGEKLPTTFFDRLTEQDRQVVDLVIVIGTSLQVAPVSEIPNYVPHDVPHIYISKEPIKHLAFDIQLLGACDDVVAELCRKAGWKLEHDAIPKDFKVDVRSTEDGHVWAVEPAPDGAVCRWDKPDPLGDLGVESGPADSTPKMR